MSSNKSFDTDAQVRPYALRTRLLRAGKSNVTPLQGSNDAHKTLA
jgi:hypothetical protein